MGAKSNRTGVLIRRGKFGHRNSYTHRGEGHVEMGVEAGVMQIPAKEHQGVLKATRS